MAICSSSSGAVAAHCSKAMDGGLGLALSVPLLTYRAALCGLYLPLSPHISSLRLITCSCQYSLPLPGPPDLCSGNSGNCGGGGGGGGGGVSFIVTSFVPKTLWIIRPKNPLAISFALRIEVHQAMELALPLPF